MADFASAFATTMKTEGWYMNDLQDTGGEIYKEVAIAMKWGWHCLFGINLDAEPPRLIIVTNVRSNTQK